MKALIDSDVLIDYLQGIPEAKTELAQYQTLLYSIISWMDIMCGAQNNESEKLPGFSLPRWKGSISLKSGGDCRGRKESAGLETAGCHHSRQRVHRRLHLAHTQFQGLQTKRPAREDSVFGLKRITLDFMGGYFREEYKLDLKQDLLHAPT